MQTTAVKIETAQNPNARTYHTRAELTDKQIETAQRGQITEVNELLRIFLLIPGIVGCYLKPYSLMIVKAPTFAWEEIEPKVLEVLENLQKLPSCE